MKLDIKLALLGALTAGTILFACGDDESVSTTRPPTTTVGPTTTTTASSSSGMAGMGGIGGAGGSFPAPPVLGTQIDRMGRPAINTALIEAFISDTGTVSVNADRGAAEDAYNANSNPGTWPTQYLETARKNLAILDSVDGVCGNSAGFGALAMPNYTTLATVLVMDWLVVKGNAASCTSYLGVELNALGLSPADDCGGRRPGDDTIDTTYGAVSGVLAGFPDNIAATADSMVTTFPFLAAP